MNFIKTFAFLGASLLSANTVFANGVSLGATRVVYPINSKQVSLPLINHSQKDRYLVNAWIENNNEKRSQDFLMTPPIFVSEANTENTFRIIKAVENLPTDRESVYWINVKTIPSIDKEVLENSNVLQLAVLSRIKLFVRPNSLPYTSEEAVKHIKFYNNDQGVVIENSSPYHVSFVNMELDGEKIQNKMAKPFAATQLHNQQGQALSFQTVNDYGGLTKRVEYNIGSK